MNVAILLLFWGLLEASSLNSSKISMPLVDNMKAVLTANLDVSDFNTVLKEFIEQEIREGVKAAMDDTVNRINTEVKVLLQEQKQTTNQTVQRELDVRFESIMKEIREVKTKNTGQNGKFAFFSRLNQDVVKLSDNSIVKFDDVILNEGECYSAETGKFTAPEDGLYVFSWTTLSKDSGDFSSGLFVNEIKIIANIVDSDSVSDSMTGSMSAVVEIKKGQQAFLKVVQSEGKHLDALWGSSEASAFMGFKL